MKEKKYHNTVIKYPYVRTKIVGAIPSQTVCQDTFWITPFGNNNQYHETVHIVKPCKTVRNFYSTFKYGKRHQDKKAK